jgi:urate oxidase
MAKLIDNSYGKSRVRLSKITRTNDRQDFKELTVDIQLQGQFEVSYTHGDNSPIVATDTMKNTVYALAKNHPLGDIESFGQFLAQHFLSKYAHVSSVQVHIAQNVWQRISVAGAEHPSAFVGGGAEKRTTTIEMDRNNSHIASGFEGLQVLKTTHSEFTGYIKDEFTTLKEATDRIFATSVTAMWKYAKTPADCNQSFNAIRIAMIECFARHHSLSVQQTLFDMGRAALDACAEIREISITMPNQHHLLANLTPFKMENPNEIFVPTSEPFGLISGTISR